MRPLIVLFLCACASGRKEAPEAAATTVAASLPSNAAPEPTATPEKHPAPVVPAPTPAAPAGPMTASEAAAAASTAQHGGAGDTAAVSEDSPCAADDDCAFTMVAPGGCCPMLCTPRAVTKKAADAIQAHVRECAQGKACPLPSCAPPRFQTVLACLQGRCVSKARETKGME